MSELRRQIKHDSGAKRVRARWRKTRQDLERQVRPKREIALPAELPATPAGALQQKHVVGIEMRADAAARNRVAHHEIVEPCVGDERETAQQIVAGCQVQIDAVHQ